jgi:uncharacterized protein (DUF427 family)
MTEIHPEPLRIEQGRKRVRAYLRGEPVADTIRPVLVWERPYYPAYYIPRSDVLAKLVESERVSQHPGRGAARHLHVSVGDTTVENAGWTYPDPTVAQLRDLVRLRWDAMDDWFEEDEPVYVHPRDPHRRVDILASSRHVEIYLDATKVADSTRPRILFETGLPPRYYLPPTDVRMDLFRPSETHSQCPYKGTASYWSVEVGGRRHEDVVWTYRAPLPESQKIAGLVAFFDERADVVVDGVPQDRPRTPFS